MKLFVHWKDLSDSDPARAHLERRLAFGLGRFAHHVRSVRALLADENGTRGGRDKSCRLQVRTRRGLLQVEECERDLYVAIDLAVERLRRTLARTLERENFQDNGRWRADGLVRRRHGFAGS